MWMCTYECDFAECRCNFELLEILKLTGDIHTLNSTFVHTTNVCACVYMYRTCLCTHCK